MGDPGRDVVHLAGEKMVDAELRLIDGIAAELEPELVVVQTAMKSELIPLGIVNLDVKNRGLVNLGPRSLLSRHAGKEVERAKLLHRPPLARNSHQMGIVPLDARKLLVQGIPSKEPLENLAFARLRVLAETPLCPSFSHHVEFGVARLLIFAENDLHRLGQPHEEAKRVGTAR